MISSKQTALRPALRWYSDAVDNSSAAPDVSTAMEEIFDSMLSDGYTEARWEYEGCQV